jgi:hypothetical protein
MGNSLEPHGPANFGRFIPLWLLAKRARPAGDTLIPVSYDFSPVQISLLHLFCLIV